MGLVKPLSAGRSRTTTIEKSVIVFALLLLSFVTIVLHNSKTYYSLDGYLNNHDATFSVPKSNLNENKINDDHDRPLPDNLHSLQELTIGKHDSTDTIDCPPPLKLYKNRIVVPSSTSTSHNNIPRILHLSERSRCLNQDMYDALQMWQESFPSFSIFFHDDAAVDRLLLSEEQQYSDWKVNFPDIVKILPCVSPGAMKIDIWRVLVLWKFGGMYFDADTPGPGKLVREEDLYPNSTWFSLSDVSDRPSQWMFASSAHHLACDNALHKIAENVLDVPNIQKTRLVYVTGPEALYYGWKHALLPDHEDSTGLLTFKDGATGQKLVYPNGSDLHYWQEKVPFTETQCMPRKVRMQEHFGHIHWTTAKDNGSAGLPPVSCRKHLEILPLNEEKEQDQQDSLANNNISSMSRNEAASYDTIDLVLRNSNNATRCANLAKENELKRNSGNYCGSCLFKEKITCNQRMDWLISTYRLSEEEAFESVVKQSGDKCKTGNKQ